MVILSGYINNIGILILGIKTYFKIFDKVNKIKNQLQYQLLNKNKLLLLIIKMIITIVIVIVIKIVMLTKKIKISDKQKNTYTKSITHANKITKSQL